MITGEANVEYSENRVSAGAQRDLGAKRVKGDGSGLEHSHHEQV